jgi:Tfp pilus assembly protein PilN
MRAVNLLPRDQVQRSRISKENLPLVVGGCTGALVAALLASLYLTQSGRVAAEQQTLENLNVQLQAMPEPPPPPTAAQTKLASEQSVRLAALQSALQTRIAWDRVLREFSLVLPEDVWLTQLDLRSPISPSTNQPASTDGHPNGLTISGSTYSHDAVARLLSRLALVPDLTNVQLVNSTGSKSGGGQQIVTFSIAADIRTSEGSS